MTKTIKVSLPGYDAQSDTNPDHYALYFVEGDDKEYVLLKEKERGGGTVANSATATITHSLGYIPYAIAFFERSSGVWRKLIGNDEFNGNDIPMEVTTTTLTIENSSGASKDYKYYIFFDPMDGTPTNELDLSGAVLAITKEGKDAVTTSDPTDFIFHSNYNTPKIILEGSYSDTVVIDTEPFAGGTQEIFTVAHGLNYIPLVDGFMKVDDWDYYCPPNGAIYLTLGSDARRVGFDYIEADATNITFAVTNYDESNAHDFTIYYYAFEVPLD